MKNRLLALLLALLMLGATACGDPAADSAGNASAGADTPIAEEAETVEHVHSHAEENIV